MTVNFYPPLQGSTEDFAPAGFKKSGALKLFVFGRVWVLSESCGSAGPYGTWKFCKITAAKPTGSFNDTPKKQVQQAPKSAFKITQRVWNY